MTITVVMLENMFVILSYRKVKDIYLGDEDQISLGRAKGRGKRGYRGEAPNTGYFCKIPIIQQDTNFFSQTVRQTSNHHHCDWHAKTPICRDFQVILSSFS